MSEKRKESGKDAPATSKKQKEEDKSLYVLHVSLAKSPEVWRQIEVGGKTSLEKIHVAIANSYGYLPQLPCAFFTGEPWNSDTYYSSSCDKKPTMSDISLADLKLKEGDVLTYLYDFGAEVSSEVKVEKITTSSTSVEEPRVVKSEGDAPQVADEADDYEDPEDDDEDDKEDGDEDEDDSEDGDDKHDGDDDDE
eukprot:TRINITY_DN6323_c0_g1_i1.p1 TRINITY_DN6323_c0_g1~~TRINITY_DN6323_c0_g1_i1.p1  ORF type:complete len:194 (+),score=72.20 TRINITY_DN6323_c0_g1_i1:78-659(+)